MNMYITLFMLAWVLSLAGYLWLAIVAFKRSIPWGVLVILFSPISAIVFSLTNWYDARKAFLVYIVSFVLFAGLTVMIYGEVGMGNMQEIAARMHSGKLAPSQAYALVKKALAHTGPTDIFEDETSVASVDAGMPKQHSEQAGTSPSSAKAATEPAQAKEQQDQAADKSVPASPVAEKSDSATTAAKTQPEVKEKTEKSETKTTPEKTSTEAAEGAGTDIGDDKETARIPVPEKAQPDPLAQKPITPKPNTITMAIDKLPHYIGHYFIITLKTGAEQRGLLRKVDKHRLILDRKLYGGNFQYKISKKQIKSIQMLTRLPDER